jgi:RNA polymerase sigma-70 factor (ECF subfamily)
VVNQPAVSALNRAGPFGSILAEMARTLDQTQALDRFLAAVERRAFRMAVLATRSEDDALDLVQEAMLKLVERYSDRDEAEWAPLFQRILQSKIRDWYRRTAVRNRWRTWLGWRDDETRKADPLEAVPDTSTPAVDDQVAHRRAARALEDAVRALPLRQQQAFLLRVWEEYDVAQTARAMGCSAGSVKTHLSRALQALREKLGDHWP